MTVSVKGITKESVQKGLQYVQKKIEKISAKMQGIGAHSLLNVGENILFGMDIVSTTDALANRKTTLTTALDQYKKDLQALLDNKESNKQGELKKKDILKFALIGFLIGIFLMVCLYAFVYIFSGKLTDSSVITEQYNIPVFGEFRKSSSIHNNRGLDKIISMWELGNAQADDNVTYNNIAALIANHRGAESFLLTSSLPEEKLKLIMEELSSRLENKTIEIKGSFLTNSEVIGKAAKAEAVILVEEKNVSRNKDIERMAETLMISQAKVIGIIVC